MLSDEEKREYEELKSLLYTGTISQFGKRKLIDIIEKQSKEIEELKEYKHDAELTKVACCTAQNCEALNNCIKLERELQNANKKWEDKIKAKIEELEKQDRENRMSSNYLVIPVLQSLLEKE